MYDMLINKYLNKSYFSSNCTRFQNITNMITVPSEIKLEICSYLDAVSITHLASTCKVMRDHIKEKTNNRVAPYEKVIKEKQWSRGLRKASEINDMIHVEFFIQKGANEWNWGMAHAARGGHKGLVEFFIQKGANILNWGLAFAAQGGHKELVDFFIQKGANNWNWGLENAARGGHKDLFDFFIQKGAKINE
jgi:hypothetical protein